MFKVLVISSFLSLSAFSGDKAAGEKLYKKINCAMCHNKDGMGKAKGGKIKMTKGPQIAGLSTDYIIAQMVAIQTKKRKTKNTSMMMGKIKKLSKADIANIAAYVSSMAPAHKGMLEK